MTKLLVTGSAGFIGSNLVEYLLSEWADVSIVSLDKLDYAGHTINLEHIPGGLNSDRHTFIHGSICDEPLVEEIIGGGIEGIINVAAHTHVDRAFYYPELFIENNVRGPLNLLKAAARHPGMRFLQVSTDEVYGAATPDAPCDEQAPLRPGNFYAASKAAADLYISAGANSKGIDTVIIRGTNNFGPRQYPEKLIPFFTRRILNNEELPLYGDGRQMRDWLFVRDFCRAIWLVFTRGQSGEIYNAGAGNHITNIELTQRMLNILGANDYLLRHVADRPGHDYCYAVSWHKLSRLGWSPAADFDKALKETIDWYRGNPRWVEAIMAKSEARPKDHEFFANHYKNHQ